MKPRTSMVWPLVCLLQTGILVLIIYLVGAMARSREEEINRLKDFNKEIIETNQILGCEVTRLDTELARRRHYPF